MQPYEDILPEFDPKDLMPQGERGAQDEHDNDMDMECYDGEGFEEDDSMFSNCTPPSSAKKSKRRKRDDDELSPSSSAE